MKQRTLQHGPMLAIAVAFLALCVAYNLRTPYRTPGYYVPAGVQMPVPGEEVDFSRAERIPDIGAPDERAHVNYVRHLVSQRSFPLFRVGDAEGYENHQPPAYYLLLAPFALASGEEAEGFVLRFVTSLLGLAAIWFCYLTLRELTGSLWSTFAGTASAAFLPSYVALSSSVSNDPPLILLFSTVLWLCVRAGKDGWNVTRLLVCGVLCGLAVLTKTSGLILVVFVFFAVLLTCPREQKPLQRFGLACLPAVLALALASPWLVRNTLAYGDPLGLRIFAEGFAGSPRAETFIAAYGGTAYLFEWVGWWTLRSLFGVFGYAMLLLPQWIYIAGGLVLLVCLIGLLRARAVEPDLMRRRGWALCGLLFALVFLGFLRFNMTYFQAQARYLLPALPSLALLFGVGWSAWCSFQLLSSSERSLPFRISVILLPAALLLANVYALLLLGPAFDAVSLPRVSWPE